MALSAVVAGSSSDFRKTSPVRCTRRCRSSASHVPRLRTVLAIRSRRRRSSAGDLAAQFASRANAFFAFSRASSRERAVTLSSMARGIRRRNSFDKQIACAQLIDLIQDCECVRQMPRPIRWRGRTQACLQAPQIGPSKWDGSGVPTHDHSPIRRPRPDSRDQRPPRHRAKPGGPAPRCGR